MGHGPTAIPGCGGPSRPRRGGPRPARLAAGIVCGLALLPLAPSRPAWCQSPPEAGRGALLLRAADGAIEPAPLLELDAVVRIGGPVARGTVTQRFVNPTDRWLEATYVFPLPESAAVDSLRMRIGDRTIEGEIREREQARRSYRQAREEGRHASLLDQQRPDVFTARVANVAPGAEIEVEIGFQQILDLDAGGFTLRLPWIVTPRFAPQRGDGAPGDAPVPRPRAEGGPRPDVALAIDLDPGFALASVTSPSHTIALEQLGPQRLLVTLAEGTIPADRDFVLRWRPVPGHEPRAVLLEEPGDGGHHLLLLLMPPELEAPGGVPAREAVFVIDTSGSMAGPSMEQARAALALALGRLTPRDRFNLVAFASTTRTLFPTPIPADPAALAQALAWLDALTPDGGTELLPALDAAFRDETGGPELRQVVLVTDGCIANEREVFALVRERLGRSRLFTVAIGAAPNSHFIAGAARFGRGTSTFIASPSEVGERMEALFAELARPVLTDVRVDWGAPAEAWPAQVPDLYHGEPVVLVARLPELGGEILVSGRLGGRPWQTRIPVVLGRDGLGIRSIFGRHEIESLMDSLVAGGDPEQVRRDVVAVALAHGLVSRWTSFVAVERTPARPRGDDLLASEVAAGLPAGFVLPAGGTAARAWLAFSVVAGALGAALLAVSRRRTT